MTAQPSYDGRSGTARASRTSYGQAQIEEAESMSEEQTPIEPVPPAVRLGEILGWSLPALAVACFIVFIIANQ